MATTTFTWLPDVGSTQNRKPNVLPAKYGDGYEQRVAVGINSNPRKWSVKLSKNAIEAKEILDFLAARNGVESFNWADPMGAIGTYVCREWKSIQSNPGVYEVSGDFEQVFE